MQNVKRGSKRILCVLISLVMVLALLPALTLTTQASTATTLNLSAANLPSGENWETWTSTIDSVEFITLNYLGEGPLTISGSNTGWLGINVQEATEITFANNTNFNGLLEVPEEATVRGMGSGVNLSNDGSPWSIATISGNGELTLTGTFGNISSVSFNAIWAGGDLTITANIGSISITQEVNASATAIFARHGDINVPGTIAIIETTGRAIVADGGSITIDGTIGSIIGNEVEVIQSWGSPWTRFADAGLMTSTAFEWIFDSETGQSIQVIRAQGGDIIINGSIGSISNVNTAISSVAEVVVAGNIGSISSVLTTISATHSTNGAITISGSVGDILGRTNTSLTGITTAGDLNVSGSVGNITKVGGGFFDAMNSSDGEIEISGSVGNITGNSVGTAFNGRNGFKLTETGSIGYIMNTFDGISVTEGYLILDGEIGSLSVRNIGLNVTYGELRINTTLDVKAQQKAFNMQPIIGLANYKAFWSANLDGQNTFSGAEYIWTWSHRVVQIIGWPDSMETTVHNGIDYVLVYNFEFYILTNPDVAAVYGDDPQGAIAHFVNNGMAEGRVAHPRFNVHNYRNANADLRLAFGYDLRAFFMHYITNGYDEDRSFSYELLNPITIHNGIDYALVYDMDTYLYLNPDIYEAFGRNEFAVLAHFVNSGIVEGRQAIDTFNVHVYRANNADVVAAFGDNLRATFMHFISHGAYEDRVAY